MAIDPARLELLVDEAVRRIQRAGSGPQAAAAGPVAPAAHTISGREGLFDDVDSAVAAARKAHEAFVEMGLMARHRAVAAMRAVAQRLNQDLAQRAVAETGLGRADHKVVKNRLAAEKTPGPEDLDTFAVSGDHGLTIAEYAPYGVIGAITPSTNPTETLINNGIGMVSGGNAVVFNFHPAAAGVCGFLLAEMNRAIAATGAPAHLLVAVEKPTIESAKALMRHAGIRLLVVTGGGAVVREAMASGKRVIAAGPGNPPVVVDETADIPAAAAAIVRGAGLDNNIVCVVEKEVFAVDSIAAALVEQMKRRGARLLTAAEARRVESLVITRDNHVNTAFVGKNACAILKAAGITESGDPPLVLAEVEAQHPFVQHEMLMPVLPVVRVRDAALAVEAAVQAEHGYGHTAAMHSRDITNLHAMARAVNTSIFVKNGPAVAGIGFEGEGFTSFTIASPTGEGLTRARHFCRVRRCTLIDSFRIV